MSALTTARKIDQMGATPEVLPSMLDVPLKANAKVFVGGMIATDSSGYGVSPTAAAGLFLVGVLWPKAGYPQVYDNTGGGNGAIIARAQEGIFSFNNGTTGDALAQADMWSPVWLMDDNTVGKTDGGATPRSLAGILCGFDSSGRPQVLVSGPINAAILAARRIEEETRKVVVVSAAGALDPTADLILLNVTGTTAYTLADGTKIGHRIRVVLLSGATTPAGTITPATPRGFATVSAIGGVGDVVELEWTATGWVPGPSNGVTWA